MGHHLTSVKFANRKIIFFSFSRESLLKLIYKSFFFAILTNRHQEEQFTHNDISRYCPITKSLSICYINEFSNALKVRDGYS